MKEKYKTICEKCGHEVKIAQCLGLKADKRCDNWFVDIGKEKTCAIHTHALSPEHIRNSKRQEEVRCPDCPNPELVPICGRPSTIIKG